MKIVYLQVVFIHLLFFYVSNEYFTMNIKHKKFEITKNTRNKS